MDENNLIRTHLRFWLLKAFIYSYVFNSLTKITDFWPWFLDVSIVNRIRNLEKSPLINPSFQGNDITRLEICLNDTTKNYNISDWHQETEENVHIENQLFQRHSFNDTTSQPNSSRCNPNVHTCENLCRQKTWRKDTSEQLKMHNRL